MMRFSIYFGLSCLLSFYINAQTPAFPTAEGFGKWVTGGRGGKVIHVTNLDDKDRRGTTLSGSFRAALETAGDDPITIVFDTAGIINLTQEIRIQRDNMTIAGQSAPGDGICIKGATVNLGGSHNLIIRHLRFRVGVTDEGEFIEGACLNIENGGGFIVDHCSFSWSAEENVGVYNNQPATIQWCISAEGLYAAGHPKGSRSYGAVLGGERATYHHNLLAHNASRSPRFGTSDKNDLHVLIEYINNVNFNWGGQNACYGGENELGAGGSVSINFINNYYKPGPAYPGTSRTNFIRPTYEVGLQETFYTQWYIAGNQIEGSANEALNTDNWLGIDISEYTENSPEPLTKEDLKSDKHEVPDPINIEDATDAYNNVIINSGAFPRDAFDARIIEELKTGTASASGTWNNHGQYGIVDKPSDSGGYPTYTTYNMIEDADKDGMGDYWELANDLDPLNPEDRNLTTSEGYTYLEVYLNAIVGEHVDGFVYPDPVYIQSDVALGIEESMKHIQVFKNGDDLIYKVLTEEKILNAGIYSIGGQKLLTTVSNDDNRINTASLSVGIYVLLVQTDHNFYSIKFLK